jgi:hypothetical protein
MIRFTDPHPPADVSVRVVIAFGVVTVVGILLLIVQPWQADIVNRRNAR